MPSSTEPLGGEPPVVSRFLFEVDGIEIGVFREVSGLEVTVALVPTNEGGLNGYTHQLPGRMEWPKIVFKRGLTQSDALFTWLNKSSGDGFAGAGNKVVRHTGAITAISHAGERLRAWQLQGVLPVKWKGPAFTIEGKNTLEEELEIVHYGFTTKTFGTS